MFTTPLIVPVPNVLAYTPETTSASGVFDPVTMVTTSAVIGNAYTRMRFGVST